MTKEIIIGKKNKKKITFTANGATALYYKQFFKKDLMQEISGESEGSLELATDKIPELAFIMAKQADKADMMKLTYQNYIEWLELFDALDLTMKGKEIFMIYVADSMPMVESKKKADESLNA